MKTKDYWLLAGYGLCFVLTVVLFVFFNAPFKQYGPAHIALTVFAIYSGFFCVWLVKKNPKIHRILTFVFAVIFVIFICQKIVYPTLYPEVFDNYYKILPLNVCNITAILIIARPFYKKNAVLDNYLLCFGILGGIANFLIGFGYTGNFFTLQNFETNVLHNLYFTYCIFMFLTRDIVPDTKAAVKNFLWITPFFFLLVFTNQIWRHNFFFTGIYENPIIAIYNLFPVFNVTMFGTVFEFNLIYYVVLLALSCLCMFLVSLAGQYAAKKIHKDVHK